MFFTAFSYTYVVHKAMKKIKISHRLAMNVFLKKVSRELYREGVLFKTLKCFLVVF